MIGARRLRRRPTLRDQRPTSATSMDHGLHAGQDFTHATVSAFFPRLLRRPGPARIRWLVPIPATQSGRCGGGCRHRCGTSSKAYLGRIFRRSEFRAVGCRPTTRKMRCRREQISTRIGEARSECLRGTRPQQGRACRGVVYESVAVDMPTSLLDESRPSTHISIATSAGTARRGRD